MTTKTKRPIDPNHPLERAKREARRGDPAELAAMRETIARVFGFRIDTGRLEPEESGELLALHKRCIEHGGWEAGSITNYGLASKLDEGEHKRWRELVSTAAGREGLLDDLDAEAAAVRKLRELAAAALQPVPTRTAAPAGSVVLPADVWGDVLAGTLLPLDLAVLSAVLFAFQGGALHPKVTKRGDAAWAAGETLIVRDGLHRLAPQWSQAGRLGDAVGADRQGVETRLAEAGWLELERQGSQLAVRPGHRLPARDAG
jgi:hypothetical protein